MEPKRSSPKKKAAKNLYNEDKKQIEESLSYKQQKQLKTYFNKSSIEKGGVRLSDKQTELYKTIRENTLTVVKGPAGTSKTFVTCYTALHLLADGKINQIVLTKPIQEAGENLGFLPGTIQEKTDPYIQSYKSNFLKIIDEMTYNFLFESGFIVFEPLAYMRGTSYDNCLMVLDENQNCDLRQLMLWVTRLGKNSKAVMMGDISQYDIRKKDVKVNIFIDQIVKNVNGASTFEFTREDIVRNKFLIDLVDNYEKYMNDLEIAEQLRKKAIQEDEIKK